MGGIEKLSVFLKQPYPFYYRGKLFVFFVITVFLLSMGFNYFFKPFNVYVPEHKMDYFWISLIHSLTPVFVTFPFVPFFKNAKTNEKWTVGKELLLIGIFLLLIGIFQFLIRDIIYDNPNNWSWMYFFEEIRNTFLVGILMMSLLTSLNFNRLNRQNIKKAGALLVGKKVISSIPSSTYIKTQSKGDNFSLDTTSFIYAKAEGNYVELYMSNNPNANKLLKRITIKDLASQLSSASHIIKTHRSYLVNLQYVEKVTGNAQGYRLQLKASKELIPVSRNMISLFEEQFTSL